MKLKLKYNFDEKYNNWKNKIETELDLLVPEKDTPEQTIYKAMRYSLLSGGKRIRPVLALAAAELVDVEEEKVMPFACAIEMIHTYSLIHDDLPAMDNDSMRRGRKTNHVVFGEDIAILAGDGLLNKAFEVMSDAVVNLDNKMAAAQAMSVIAKCSGTDGMVGGQVVDLESEGNDISLDVLLYMHSKKTGALIKAACTLPALFAGGKDSSNYKTLSDFAHNLGIAFQIKDDILDVKGDSAILGKTIGKDKEQKKMTFLSFFDLNKCEELLREYTDKALQSLDKYGPKAEFLREMCMFLLEREY